MRLLFVSLALAAACLAQDITGSIAGTVLDSSGGAVPSAKVTITEIERNQIARKLVTDASGNYSAPLLPVGIYSIVVEAQGFKKAAISRIQLNLNDNVNLNIPLEVGQVTDQVSVEASAVSVELQSAAASGLVSGTRVREQQLSSRNLGRLCSLVPGVSASNTDQLYIGAVAPAVASTSAS